MRLALWRDAKGLSPTDPPGDFTEWGIMRRGTVSADQSRPDWMTLSGNLHSPERATGSLRHLRQHHRLDSAGVRPSYCLLAPVSLRFTLPFSVAALLIG
jgi:hypothetical protein